MKKSKSNSRKASKKDRLTVVCAPQRYIRLDYSPTMRFRFSPPTMGTSGNAVFTVANLLSLVNVAINASTAKNLFTFVKLRSIRISVGGLPIQGGADEPYATLAFQDVGAAQAGSGDVYEVSPQAFEVGVIHVRPKVTQRWGQWLGPADNLSFVITNSDNQCVIELALSFRAVNGVNGITLVGSGLTPGGVYFRGLDGNQLSATLYPIVCAAGDSS